MMVTVTELYRRYGRYDEPRRNRAATLALVLAVASALLLVSSALLYRAHVVDLGRAFVVVRWAAYGAIATVLVAVVAVIIAVRRGTGMAIAVTALLLLAAVFAMPVAKLRQAMRLPQIHDITTDTEQPPRFVSVVALRAGAANSIDYGGPELAAQQRRGYPDLQPLSLTLPPNQAFDKALAAARTLGWEIVASDPAAGRIEATDTTFWFGFKDDVVVRVAEAPGGSRVDVRSVSRVGLSDVGTNAARIRTYLDALRKTSSTS
jgi:uncharacterized protein (DUF1499 family)/uncharacterized membrane protein